MGKNRHSKDKLYIVANEFNRDWGGYKKRNSQLPFKCLPFFCCGLSLLPFNNPVCTSDGIVFDADNILAYIKKYKRNPVNGAPLSIKDLVVLHFYKNAEEKYHCPVTYKEFNEHTHIVANRLTGNVYSNEAVDSLCRRPKKWNDLLTDEPFQPTDLITIQNPHEVGKREIGNFEYIKTAKLLPIVNNSVKGVAADEGSMEAFMKCNELEESIITEAKKTEEDVKLKHNKLIPNIHHENEKVTEVKEQPKHTLFTTHRQASSFTSTAVLPSFTEEFRPLTDKEQRDELYKVFRKKQMKGYVRLVTNLGILNIELHVDKVPETCHNFLLHCESKYYQNTVFHRSIPRFMIQGGDPTGSGTGGQSAFENGLPFGDEFHPHLIHKGSGVLSMANSGKNTNKSQFFITYNSADHLNNKHTVFGRLVKGFDTLQKMEGLITDPKTDRPKQPPVIEDILIFKNPFKEYLEEMEKQKEKEQQLKAKEAVDSKTATELLDPMQKHAKRQTTEIGKYTNSSLIKKLLKEEDDRKRSIPLDSQFIQTLKKSRPDYSFSNW